MPSRGQKGATLEIKNVAISFGGLQALIDVSLVVEPGSIHSLIGPNGSGKTTLINIITGFYKPTSGEVRFDGKAITGLEPHRIAKLGIVRTFQGVKLFSDMLVGENLIVGRHLRTKASLFEDMFSLKRSRQEQVQNLRAVSEMLEYFGLRRETDHIAGDLPFGHQRLLEVSRTLITEPRLMILDEPAAGLSNEEITELMRKLRVIRESGVGVLLVEHHMRFVLGISDVITVLDFGSKIAEGTPEEIIHNEKVLSAYLGKTYGRLSKKTGR